MLITSNPSQIALDSPFAFPLYSHLCGWRLPGIDRMTHTRCNLLHTRASLVIKRVCGKQWSLTIDIIWDLFESRTHDKVTGCGFSSYKTLRRSLERQKIWREKCLNYNEINDVRIYYTLRLLIHFYTWWCKSLPLYKVCVVVRQKDVIPHRSWL